MGISVLVLTLAAAATLAIILTRNAARSIGATFEVTPVSDYWLSQRRRVREEAID
jgi:hypothetical protein